MLSFIVPGSSAEKSGLRVGDYLIAVSGQNVSKVPHDEVVQTIGDSNVVKLQIAENYYSDSSDDEFVTTSRPKPKYPHRLRHKQQQTRAERVVRDLQSGAIFSERAAIQLGEAALLSDRDWPDTLSGSPPTTNYHHKPTSPITTEVVEGSTSPTRRRLMPPPFPEARQKSHCSASQQFEEQLEQLTRARLSPVKNEKIGKNKMLHQFHQLSPPHQKQPIPQPLKQLMISQQQQHGHQHLRPPVQTNYQYHGHQHQQNALLNSVPKQRQISPPSVQLSHHHIDNDLHFQQQQFLKQQYHQQLLMLHHHQDQQQLSQLQSVQQQQQPQQHHGMHHHHHHHPPPPVSHQQQQQHPKLQQQNQQACAFSNDEESSRVITEQEINQILYPTLAELQLQGPPPDLGESLYRAVVGYLGTIEVPKDSQGGSRLTAIKNCIRRLRIEKKVHTLVLMSVFTERVVLTNPHGITLAQYPAERITFCGVYADDKKFFGLVTVHGCSSDEFSDASQDGRAAGMANNDQGISSSCHVFMVDPSIVQHADHLRRAKSFRIECSPAGDDVPLTQCREFPESADPILHTIMSLYRSQPGFNFDGANMGDEAQMSPQHSNTSSNSSNSDSGIGFRDEGGSHPYSRHERVFVVEVDDNKRMRIQNYHLVANSRNNNNNSSNNNNHLINNVGNGANSSSANFRTTSGNSNNNCNGSQLDNLFNSDNARASGVCYNGPSGSSNGLCVESNGDSVHRPGNSNTNPRTNSAERNKNSSNKVNFRAISTGDRLRTNKCDSKSAKLVSSDEISANVINENISNKENCDSSYMKSIIDSSDELYGACKNMTDCHKVGLSDSNRRRRNELRALEAPVIDGRSSITDELRAAMLMGSRGETRSSLGTAMDGRSSVITTKEKRGSGSRTPAVECSSPSDVEKLTVRAMPDPVGIERSPLHEVPPHVNSMRYSMHKYLQSKQQHLVKASQKIIRRDSDTDGIHPLSVRAFSPANIKKKATTPTPSSATQQSSLDLELSLKLSPKVYGLPVACLTPSKSTSAPSERSFSRSLEDLRDSSTSDGVSGSVGAQRGSFRDGSESDQGLERFRQCPLPSRLPMGRYLHASETNLSSYGASSHCSSYNSQEIQHRGAFRAVPPRAPPRPPSETEVGSRLNGARPCGIASIHQIINGITRMGVGKSVSPLTVSGAFGEDCNDVCASRNNSDNTLMGPPASTTVLKSANSDSALKNGHNHTRNHNHHHIPNSSSDYHFNMEGTYGGDVYSQGPVPCNESPYPGVGGLRDSTDGEYLAAFSKEELPSQEEYTLDSDFDNEVS